ncbi:hypothetical protein MtrunA17_Chr1g0147831 [Medicago truncatula]|uniref:Uncharacterized protein n=1 Tax=Medicago truncatula TaxID=3880 RepID=A0A396JF44_MEDTR|nr:hypothetical protein MtrunA17_Chr1g0147831 [Medicago truncatula]
MQEKCSLRDNTPKQCKSSVHIVNSLYMKSKCTKQQTLTKTNEKTTLLQSCLHKRFTMQK